MYAAGLLYSGPLGIVRASPAVFGVEGIPEGMLI